MCHLRRRARHDELRAGAGRATSISRERIERVPAVVHAQIRSMIRVLRSLGPRSEGETAYSPAFLISGVAPESKPAGRMVRSDIHHALDTILPDGQIACAIEPNAGQASDEKIF